MQSFADVLEIARHAESTGWDGIYCADHFMPDGENTRVPWPECWTTLAALAVSVPRLRLGPLVTGNTYRHQPPGCSSGRWDYVLADKK